MADAESWDGDGRLNYFCKCMHQKTIKSSIYMTTHELVGPALHACYIV